MQMYNNDSLVNTISDYSLVQQWKTTKHKNRITLRGGKLFKKRTRYWWKTSGQFSPSLFSLSRLTFQTDQLKFYHSWKILLNFFTLVRVRKCTFLLSLEYRTVESALKLLPEYFFFFKEWEWRFTARLRKKRSGKRTSVMLGSKRRFSQRPLELLASLRQVWNLVHPF